MTQSFEENLKSYNIEDLKSKILELQNSGADGLDDLVKMNHFLISMLEDKGRRSKISPKFLRLKGLISKLTTLITARINIAKEIESKQYALQKLYLDHKDSYFLNKSQVSNTTGSSDQKALIKELEHVKAERDKTAGLVKVLLATLQSSRIQSEENFQKLKYSSDLMFHILYKAEDAFFGGEEIN